MCVYYNNRFIFLLKEKRPFIFACKDNLYNVTTARRKGGAKAKSIL